MEYNRVAQESVLDEFLIGLMIDDGLDNYNDYYKCKFDGNCC